MFNLLKTCVLSLAVVVLFAALPVYAQMNLTSESFKEGEVLDLKQVFNGFGCEGMNLSPQLSWSGVPETAKSLALTIYDPDAPTGSGWWHWLIVNMPIDTTVLGEGASGRSMPDGVIEIENDYGAVGFGGACPPVGDEPHHYIVTLFALDVDALDMSSDTPAAQVGYNLNAHAIEKATLTGRYGR